MTQIQWAMTSYEAHSLPLSAQRIVNFYAEQSPPGGKDPIVLSGTPGIKNFCSHVGNGPIRGMHDMGGVLYAISGDVLYSVRDGCNVTALGSIGVGVNSDSSNIEGAFVPASASVDVIDGSSGGSITSFKVDGVEALTAAVPWDTDCATTAAALLDAILNPPVAVRPTVRGYTGGIGPGHPVGPRTIGTGSVDLEYNSWNGGFRDPVVGDTLFAWVSAQGGNFSIAPPSPQWIEIFHTKFKDGQFADHTTYLWYKPFVVGDADTTHTFTATDCPDHTTVLFANELYVGGLADPAYGAIPNNVTAKEIPLGDTLDNTDMTYGATNPLLMCFITSNHFTLWENDFQPPFDTLLDGWSRQTADDGGLPQKFHALFTNTGKTGAASTGVWEWSNATSKDATVNMVAFNGAHSDFVPGDYEIEIVDNGSGSPCTIKITQKDGGGESDDSGATEIVIVVEGDITLSETTFTLTGGFTMPPIQTSTGGAGIPLKNPDCVSMSHNAAGTPQLCIVDGTNGWIYDTTNGLVQITDADYFSADVVDFQDQYFVFNRAGTGQFFLSNLNDGTAYLATDIATSEGDPDNIVALISNRRELWLFNAETIEIWYNSGNNDFPFSRFEGGFLERGCAAAFSIAEDDNSIFWLGEDKIFYRADGYTPQRISQHGIEDALRKYTVVSDACAFIYTMAGHKFYVCTFPAEDHTWVYDITTGLWHERQSVGMGRWRVNTYVNAYGKHLVGDSIDGKIGELDLDTYQEYGAVMQGQATGPVAHQDRKRISHHRFELDIESGVGLTSGQGSEPQVWLDWSDNGGRSWSARKPFRSMGKIGEYQKRLRWNRMGSARERIYRLTVSDPVIRAILAAHLTARPGRA